MQNAKKKAPPLNATPGFGKSGRARQQAPGAQLRPWAISPIRALLQRRMGAKRALLYLQGARAIILQ
jgi:hypothetical protein